MHASSYHIVFRVTGSNIYKADTGTLTLYHGKNAVIQSDGFSGGVLSPAQSPPIPPETYHIDLRMRGVVDSFDQTKEVKVGSITVQVLHNFWGMEKIDLAGAQVEWGHYRAALNEPKLNMPTRYRGNFLHGKLRAEDYTHGCICERSEQILAYLWKLKPQRIPVRVMK